MNSMNNSSKMNFERKWGYNNYDLILLIQLRNVYFFDDLHRFEYFYKNIGKNSEIFITVSNLLCKL